MNVLLDTHVLLWWLKDTGRLGAETRQLIRSPATSIWVSAASIWEISIKAALGRLELREPFTEVMPRELERQGFRPLPITFQHALAVRNLPLHHADPFDRMLIAQAQCEDLTLVTSDPRIRDYDIRTIDAAR
jgi:PIN domain nuclease of toxin-antitoxin system